MFLFNIVDTMLNVLSFYVWYFEKYIRKIAFESEFWCYCMSEINCMGNYVYSVIVPHWTLYYRQSQMEAALGTVNQESTFMIVNH